MHLLCCFILNPLFSGSRDGVKGGKSVPVSFIPNVKEWIERLRDIKELLFPIEERKPEDVFFVNFKNLPLSDSSDIAIWHLFQRVTGVTKANVTQIR